MARTRRAVKVAMAIGISGAASGSVAASIEAAGVDVVEITLDGSVQNPPSLPTEPNCSSRCGVGGYNLGPADLVVVPLDGSEPWELIADGWDNVSLPGSAWSEAADAIVYSSTEDPHDEIWMIDVGGDHTTRRITLHDGDRTVARVIDDGGMFTAP